MVVWAKTRHRTPGVPTAALTLVQIAQPCPGFLICEMGAWFLFGMVGLSQAGAVSPPGAQGVSAPCIAPNPVTPTPCQHVPDRPLVWVPESFPLSSLLSNVQAERLPGLRRGKRRPREATGEGLVAAHAGHIKTVLCVAGRQEHKKW